MRLVFVHFVCDNFGDTHCCPRLVRPEWASCPEYDIADYQSHARPDDVLVIGGGGLLHPRIDAWIQRTSRRRPVFVWGIGINYHDGVVPDLEPLLERCVRVTLRHRANPQYAYCPCPSLGRPEFAECMAAPVMPTNDVVFFSHKEHVISRESGIAGVPELLDSRAALKRAGKDDLTSVLRFLGSGRVVVTNSYHGVLWGMALGRAVVVWRPFSTCFDHQKPFLREPDAFVNTVDELKQAFTRLRQNPRPPDGDSDFALLREAREKIRNEAETVLRTLPTIQFNKPKTAPPALAPAPRIDECAIAACRNAIERAPGDAKPRLDLGNLLRQQNKHAEAIAAYREAIALDPGLVAAHNCLGISLAAIGRLDEAIQSYGRAIELDPAYSHAYNNLGTALGLRNDLDKALPNFRKAVELDPLSASARFNLANGCQAALLLDEAIASYERGVALAPGVAAYRWNYAVALLLAGRYEKGWQEFEWRWTGCPELAAVSGPSFKPPEWKGEDIAGKTVLLYCEQGLGDSIQFIRYAPLVAARGARVIVQCQASLVRLLRGAPGIDAVITGKPPLPHFDVHRALMSLPLLLGTTLKTIPARVPYLAADKDLAARWRTRLAGAPSLKVGLAWGGNEKNRGDASRSLPLADFEPLAGIPSVRFYSLQKGGYAAQAKSPPAGMHLTDWMDDVADFADTAALIENLDLVISVDTAVAHLAGALGKPVWLLNRHESEWRWMLERKDSPWYPTLRIFRQPRRGDWPSVMQEVAKALANIAGKLRKTVSGTDVAGDARPAPPDAPSVDLARTEQLIRQAMAKAPTAKRQADLAEVLKLQGKTDEAIAAYRKAVRLDPGDSRFRMSLGNLLIDKGDVEQAIPHYRQAIVLRPTLASAHSNLGSALATIGQYQEGIGCIARAASLEPGNAEYQWNHAVALLQAGDYAAGWDKFEWRWRLKGVRPKRYKAKPWPGLRTAGGRLLLWGEQGMGDEVHFSGMVGELADAGLKVTLEIDARLVPLMQRSFPTVNVAPRSDPPAFDLADFDWQCPIGSLGVRLRPDAKSFPRRAGYLRPDLARVAALSARLRGPGVSRVVGLSWTSANQRTGFRNSVALEDWAEILRVPGIRFVDLQYGDTAEARNRVKQMGLDVLHLDDVDLFNDLEGLAALCGACDLVITSGNATAPMAGALGRPTWVLLPIGPGRMWHWLAGHADSPWYPSMQIFNQKKLGDWREPLARVARELRTLAGPGGRSPAGGRKKRK